MEEVTKEQFTRARKTMKLLGQTKLKPGDSFCGGIVVSVEGTTTYYEITLDQVIDYAESQKELGRKLFE